MFKAIIEKKQSQRSAAIQELASVKRGGGGASFSERERVMKLLRLSLSQVVAQVQQGTISEEDVVAAYLMRALDVAVDSNFLAEICQGPAPKRVASDHSLRGVTFSVADWIGMSSYDSTCGLASRALKPMTEDAVVVKVLRDHLQARPLFRTSVAQAAGSLDMGCFASETVNATWGRALNPHNKEFSTGGACGGEAGLVASNSIGIGLAVDVFGDARYPAACCGVVAFKPTSKRMSQVGVSHASTRQAVCQAVVTPIARSVKDISCLLKALWDSKGQSLYDKAVCSLPFNH